MNNIINESSLRPKWRKIAYGGMQPGFDDNHTDESFLEDMVMNANVVKRDILKVMQDSVSISQYLCIVALVGLVWVHTLQSTLDESSLLLLDASLFGSGLLVLLLTKEMRSLNLLFHYILNLSFFTTGLYMLAPLYHTLTRSISSDSIWAVTVSLVILHLFLHDYSGSTIKAPRGPKQSKLNQLCFFKCICRRFSFYRVSPSIKAACVCHHAIFLASLPFCSICHLRHQEILLPLAPSVFLWVDGCDPGFGSRTAQLTFCATAGFIGVYKCFMSLLAHKNSGIQV